MTAENCLRSKSCYTSAPKAEKACSPSKRARSLGWTQTSVVISPAQPPFFLETKPSSSEYLERARF